MFPQRSSPFPRVSYVLASKGCGKGTNRDSEHAVDHTMPRFLQNLTVEGGDEMAARVDLAIHTREKEPIRSGAFIKDCSLKRNS